MGMLAAIVVAPCMAAVLSGCVLSGSALGDGIDRSLQTASIAPGPTQGAAAPAPEVSDEDSDAETIVNAVSSIAISGQPIPWQNALTGSSGVISTASERRMEGGIICRSFVASRNSYDGVRNYSGSACLDDTNGWKLTRFDQI